MTTIKIDDFDISKLPKNCQDKNSGAFKTAVKAYFENDYGKSGLFATVKVDDEFIYVSQNKEPEEMLDSGIQLLQQGDYKKGKATLEELFANYPNNAAVLYNLGMICSDEGDLNRAIELLSQATKINTGHAHAWTALAVAHGRSNDLESAVKAANTAAQVDPDDPYVLRTAGTLIAQSGNHSRALALLEKAVKTAPDDPIALYSLAEFLRTSGVEENDNKSDELYERVIDLSPGTSLAAKAKDRRREFAYKGFRKAGDLRPDAVMYCLDALKKFSEMSTQTIGGVAMETATLGQGGIDIRNPDKSYKLRTIPGSYSGLNVVCILHSAIQKIAPGEDSGFDVQAEYEEALKLFNDNNNERQ